MAGIAGNQPPLPANNGSELGPAASSVTAGQQLNAATRNRYRQALTALGYTNQTEQNRIINKKIIRILNVIIINIRIDRIIDSIINRIELRITNRRIINKGTINRGKINRKIKIEPQIKNVARLDKYKLKSDNFSIFINYSSSISQHMIYKCFLFN